jgi:hypothetical protein
MDPYRTLENTPQAKCLAIENIALFSVLYPHLNPHEHPSGHSMALSLTVILLWGPC